jgi:hypothetical protein
MPTGDKARYTGVVFVTPATEKKPANVWVVSQHYKDQGIKRKKSVNYADSRLKIKANWMCILLTVIYVIRLCPT